MELRFEESPKKQDQLKKQVLPVALQQQAAAEVKEKGKLDGDWTGSYWYGEIAPPTEVQVGPIKRILSFIPRFLGLGGALAVEFRATLKATALGCEGRITETVAADGDVRHLVATLLGAVDSKGVVHFTKKYDGTGGASHAVEYEGRFSPDGKTIEGTWFLAHNKGGFRMRRR